MKKSLDIYDEMPSGMKAYLANYGFHFNKKACMKAIECMEKKGGERLNPMNKEIVQDILSRNKVTLHNDTLYDSVYVANMAMADYMGRSIEDERHLALFVKDYIDDPDGSDEKAFRHYLQDCIAKGEPIEWDDIL